MSEVRVKLSSANITPTVVNAIWDGELTHKIERDRIYHLYELKGDVTLVGADYSLVYDLEDDCEEITMIVEVKCAGVWEERWRGVFTKFDCKFNIFQCTATFQAKPDTTYQCIFDGWDTAENIYNAGDEVIVQEFFGTYESGIQCCYECKPPGSPVEPVCTSTDACEEKTVYTEILSPPEYPGDCEIGDFFAYTCFHRILGTGTPTVPPVYGTGWTLLSGSTWWRCPDEDDDPLSIGVLRRGRLFNDVMEHLVSQLGCSITLKSHFFNINADHVAPPSNDAYEYAELYYQKLLIFQKSDVKRPFGDPSFSFIWNMKLKDLLADLQTMFNVFWRLDGTDLILEHISYFEAAAGPDYSTVVMPLELEYDINTPKSERFVWSDEDCHAIFKGMTITYNCGNDQVERKVQLFSTDVEFVRTEAYQDRVNDDNWVLVSATFADPIYFINDKNKPLSWTNLHDKLHRHWRPFTSGTLNGSPVTFTSVQPLKKQPEFIVPNCCDSDFDPAEYITTILGEGRVQEAVENLYQDTLTLQLNY